ncbi:MAG TPA: FAD-dependent oxidoreductase, partial [Ottowia sp.]|uniref:FAD-dependent oxidoreductase n=1 Tax=Ottowia sp. TaxID=1898956 RepID=UPI002B8C5E48
VRLSHATGVVSRLCRVSLEPALAPVRCTIAGAVYTPSEEAGSCEKLTEGLFEQLCGMDGVSIHMDSPVRYLERRGGRIVAARCDVRRIQADHFVIAAGMASRHLMLPLGSSPLLYPIKGYSLSVPGQGASAPAISVTDYERRTVYVSLGDTLRIVAMVGIGVRGDVVEPDRVALMKQQARELLPAVDLDAAQPWAGERPATPDGMPRIGRSRAGDNLWLNIGHGGLGFTLACGSAVLLQHLMADEPPPVDPAPFQPDC